MAVLAYVAATLLTEWVFIGDSPDYARASAARVFGVNCEFLEFGHLAWRPLGTALLQVFVAPREGDTFRLLWLNALQQLNGAAWTFGLVGVVGAAGWLRASVRSFSAAAFGVALLIVCKAYLNYAQVGSPYVPGLGMLLAGLYVASLEPRRPSLRLLTDVAAGLCFAASALLWGTYALVLPGAVLAPLALKRDWKRQLPRVLVTGIAGVAALCVVYVAVGRSLGFHTLADYRAWVAGASHGIATGGLPRAVIGLARSFVDVGDYGQLVKRYLMKDPYSPVSAGALVSLGLLKIVVFYLTMLVIVVAAARGTIGRRALVVCVLIAVPVLGFAVAWQGGDLERYLPGMPALILLGAAAFHEARGRPLLRATMLLGVGVFAVSNAVAMSNVAVQRENAVATGRLAGFEGNALARNVFVVSHWQDDLMAFNRDRPFHDVNLRGFNVYALLTPGTPEAPVWRDYFARRVLVAWENGDRVLVSSRLFSRVPAASWNWVEGDDDRVSWKDLHQLFGMLETTPPAAGAEEFRELVPTPGNRNVLEGLGAPPPNEAASGGRPAGSPDAPAPPGACRVSGSARRIGG